MWAESVRWMALATAVFQYFDGVFCVLCVARVGVLWAARFVVPNWYWYQQSTCYTDASAEQLSWPNSKHKTAQQAYWHAKGRMPTSARYRPLAERSTLQLWAMVPRRTAITRRGLSPPPGRPAVLDRRA